MRSSALPSSIRLFLHTRVAHDASEVGVLPVFYFQPDGSISGLVEKVKLKRVSRFPVIPTQVDRDRVRPAE
jgi:hypothetical protein